MNTLKTKIQSLIFEYENPKRVALSIKYPKLKPFIVWLRRSHNFIKNNLNFDIKTLRSDSYFPCVVARHQSVLRRKLWESDPKLQENKVTNIEKAIKNLDGIIIPPGKIFSFWDLVWKPTYKKWYLDGMLLSNGKVIEWVGGWLCQLSNFLYWIFLHTPVEIIERYHHSLDVFPDSGRILPFWSGATISYNMIDLKIKNKSDFPLQIKIFLTNNHLKWQILSPKPIKEKYHIIEKNHYFIKRWEKYFRYNELFREEKIEWIVIKEEFLTSNFAPVLYDFSPEYLEKNHFELLDFSNEKI